MKQVTFRRLKPNKVVKPKTLKMNVPYKKVEKKQADVGSTCK